ncbi:D-2-hydroxyacid dehydrogenase [Halorussus salinisoli]|uniref:D-2-hydroxyacid dehydrogenase n=1 Tax=Halorussus salinisoli TaxID=2558242 RepID=UPI0010C1B0B7|nr:D-2-hydroxyacid dehydrogenase [Halorussus salinisoli]
MAEQPTTLLLHEAPHGGNSAELAREIERQATDVDLQLAESYDDARTRIESADIVITRELTSELLDHADNLDWIQALNAGVDSYDLNRIEDMGVILTNAAGVHANPIAEQVLGYMLIFERNLHRGIEQQRQNIWQHYSGGELRGQTLGVLGVGEIGGRIAELGSALGMTVLGTKRDTSTAPDTVDEIHPPDETHQVLAESDYVAIACPLTDQTEGLLGLQEFASMKRDGVVINIGRGPVINQDDLVTAIQKGKIRGAALDVTDPEPLPLDSPLWDLSDVIVTPHMAGSTPHYWERSAEIFATNYERYLAGETDAFVNRVI